MSVKEEIQKSKDIAINESKIFLSKQLSEYEDKNKKLEKHNSVL